jgi:hypothetical protein
MATRVPSRLSGILPTVVLAVVLLGLMATPAEAYIDTGNGGMIINLIVSAFFGALFFLRSAIGNAVRWIKSLIQTPNPK